MYTPIFTHFLRVSQRIIVICCLWSTLSTAAANQLEKVGFSTLPGNRVQINLNFSQTVAMPLSFSTDNPARIVLDFPDISLNLNRKSQPIGVGMVQSASAVETSDRTRVVLNLVRMVPYNIDLDNQRVLISVDNAGALQNTPTREEPLEMAQRQATAAVSQPVSMTPRPAATPIPMTATPLTIQAAPPTAPEAGMGDSYLQDIDFRRTGDGTGRVVITLSKADIVVNTYEQGNDIILEFLNANLPKHLDRRLDVVDFGTPITLVDSTMEGNNARLKISATGDFEYFASQTENTYTVEVQQKVKIKSEEITIEERKYEGQLVSFNFQNIEVRAALALLFDLPGVNLNMVASDGVSGNITLRLKKIPWDQALDIILEARRLGQRRLGNVVMIDLKENIDERKQKELDAARRIRELEPLRTEFIQINYAKAKDLESLLRTKGEHSFLSERGNVSTDDRTNTLIIQDTVAKLAEIRALISSLDTPVRQVLIESRVVLASENFGRQLGVKFGYGGNEDLGQGNGIVLGGKISGDTAFNGATAFNEANSAPYASGTKIQSGSENFIVSLPISSPSAAVGLAIGKIGSYLLQLELAAAESEGSSRIVSNPRVITGNQTKATILQGTEIPYRTIQEGTSKTEFKQAVLSLEVEPQITPDDRIIMNLKVTSDKVGQATPDGNLSIDKREVQTRVQVDNGETVVLGGVYEQSDSNSLSRIPFLSDLPLIGELFKSRTQSRDQKELLIFVTPKIIKEAT